MDAQLFSTCIQRIKADVDSALEEIEPHPYISVGGAKTQQPFEVIVREIATDVTIEDVVTNTYMGGHARGGYSLTFSVAIEMWAKTADLIKSTDYVQEWYLRIAGAIAADKTLGGACDHAVPFLTSTGTAPANNKYMAAIEGGIRIKAEIDPLAE